jgi:hypothetical protein
MDNSSGTEEDRIKARAFAIWEEAGRPDGLADQHRRQAAAEVADGPEPSGGHALKTARRRSKESSPPSSATPPDPAGDQEKDAVPLVAPSDSEGG